MKKHLLLPTLILGWIFILYEYAIRVSNSVIIDRLIDTLAINASGIGILSAAYYITYVAMQLPAGLLIDRIGIRRCWPMALLSIALGCYLFAHSDSTFMASIARMFMGFGSAFAWVGAVKVIHRFSHNNNPALYIGISMSLCMLGAMLGQEPWLYLTNICGTWQKPYLIAGFMGVVIGLLVYILGHDYRHEPSKMPKVPEIIHSIMPLLRSKIFWLLILYLTAISAPQNAFSALWATEFLKQNYQLSPQLAASVLSLLWLGGLLGAPVIGYISDRIAHQKKFLVYSGIVTILLMLLIIYWRPHSIIIIGVLLFLIGFVTNASVIIYALAAKMTPNMATSSIIGVANMINMGGAALIQALIGWALSATMTPGTIGNFIVALSIIPILLLLTTLSLVFVKRETT